MESVQAPSKAESRQLRAEAIWNIVKQNYKILQEKEIAVANRAELVEMLQEKVAKSDLKQAVKDVEKFLFHPEQAKWILDLPKYLDDYAKAVL